MRKTKKSHAHKARKTCRARDPKRPVYADKNTIAWRLPNDIRSYDFTSEFRAKNVGFSRSGEYFLFFGPGVKTAVRSANAAVARLRKAGLVIAGAAKYGPRYADVASNLRRDPRSTMAWSLWVKGDTYRGRKIEDDRFIRHFRDKGEARQFMARLKKSHPYAHYYLKHGRVPVARQFR